MDLDETVSGAITIVIAMYGEVDEVITSRGSNQLVSDSSQGNPNNAQASRVKALKGLNEAQVQEPEGWLRRIDRGKFTPILPKNTKAKLEESRQRPKRYNPFLCNQPLINGRPRRPRKSEEKEKGNNPFGRKGTLACARCRQRRRKVNVIQRLIFNDTSVSTTSTIWNRLANFVD